MTSAADATARLRLADQAWEAHAAMQRATAADSALGRNPAWTALCDTAFARYLAAVTAL